MDEIGTAIVAAVIGGLAGGSASFIALRWSTNKSLEEAEKRLRIQLLYEDKKRTLKTIHSFLNNPYPSFVKGVESFLETPESEFLPEEFKREFRKEISDMEEYEIEAGLAPPPSSEDEFRKIDAELEEYYRSLPYWEKVRYEHERRINSLKDRIKRLIHKHMKP